MSSDWKQSSRNSLLPCCIPCFAVPFRFSLPVYLQKILSPSYLRDGIQSISHTRTHALTRVHFLLVCGPFCKLCGCVVCVLNTLVLYIYMNISALSRRAYQLRTLCQNLHSGAPWLNFSRVRACFSSLLSPPSRMCAAHGCDVLPRKVAGNASAYIWHSSPWEFLINMRVYVGFMRAPLPLPPFPFPLWQLTDYRERGCLCRTPCKKRLSSTVT